MIQLIFKTIFGEYRFNTTLYTSHSWQIFVTYLSNTARIRQIVAMCDLASGGMLTAY